MPSKDGIDNIYISFDKHELKFRAGEVITGKIVVIVDETTPTRGVLLVVKGVMNIFWREIVNGGNVDFAEIEDYLDEKIKVWIPNKKNKEEQWLFPGTHEYPFNYTLPIDIPESMGEDSKYGKINYTIKASILLPRGETTNSMEDTFYVAAVPDPSVPKPHEDDLPKENCTYAKIPGTCFMGRTDVELYMKLEKNVYQLGDEIPVHVEVTVKGSSKVDRLIVLLVQEAIYICNLGTKDEVRKRERLVMSEAEDTEDADPGECQGYDLTLRVDENMPLTHYPWCEFINMGYYIHAVARTHSFYDDIVVKLPLIIEPLDENKVNLKDEEEEVVVENEEKSDGEDSESGSDGSESDQNSSDGDKDDSGDDSKDGEGSDDNDSD